MELLFGNVALFQRLPVSYSQYPATDDRPPMTYLPKMGITGIVGAVVLVVAVGHIVTTALYGCVVAAARLHTTIGGADIPIVTFERCARITATRFALADPVADKAIVIAEHAVRLLDVG
jgi:hypothetical protein